MSRSLLIGDWVNSYSKGIYRIEKIIDQYYDESDRSSLFENKIGDKYPDKTIITKRLLNSKFKKSLGYENCSETFISHLDKNQFVQLKQILDKNPQLLIDLDNYKIPVLQTIYNSPLQIDDKKDLEKVLGLIDFIKMGRTFLEIENEMRRLDILRLIPKNYGNYNFQLTNFDEEYLNKRKIWRDAKLSKS